MDRPFEGLTYLGQVRRLSRLARKALARFGIGVARLHLIQHAENTTFRVVASERVGHLPDDPNYAARQFLLRVHRRGYQSREEIDSELAWLRALVTEADLCVPAPVAARSGEEVVEVATGELPDGRCCSLLRWMGGRSFESSPTRARVERIGGLAARLHRQARLWERPRGFTRRRWDHDGLLGDGGGFGMPIAGILEMLSSERREIVEGVSERAASAISVLDGAEEAFGLIHADLHMGNVLFDGASVRVIDFDDCGFGPWIYDLAVPIADWHDREDRLSLRDGLLAGYRAESALPVPQLELLDTFVAVRLVSLALWATGRTSDHPRFRERQERWVGWCLEEPRRFLGL